MAKLVYESFGNCNSLFIFDNVEEFSHLDQFRPKGLGPSCRKPYVIITSRRRDLLMTQKQVLELNVLTLQEAIQFITEHIPNATLASSEALANELQRFPLALQQTIAYINSNYIVDDISLDKYLAEFRTSTKNLIDDVKFKQLNDYEHTTLTTWSITMDRIKTKEEFGKSAMECLKILAYLNPDSISLKLLGLLISNSQPSLKILQKFSMITIENCIVKIRRVIQLVVRLRIDSIEEQACIKTILNILALHLKDSHVSEFERECTMHGVHLFQFQQHYDTFFQSVYTKYLENFCRYLSLHGQQIESLNIATKFIEKYQTLYDVQHRDLLKMKLAQIQSCGGNITLCLARLQELSQVSETHLGEDNELTLEISCSLAVAWSDDGQHEKALEILDRIIPMQTRTEASTTLLSVYFKGIILFKLGRLEEGLKCFSDACARQVRVCGDHDPTVLKITLQIANVLYKRREVVKALEVYQNLYERQKMLFGVKASSTMQTEARIKKIEEKLVRKRNEMKHNNK